MLVKKGCSSSLTSKLSIFRLEKDLVLYIAQIVLLFCIAVACAVSFGFNAKELSIVNTAIYNVETNRLLSSCVVLLSRQPLYFGTEAASASANEELISKLETLENRKELDLDFKELHENLDICFEYGPKETDEDNFIALKALNIITSQLAYASSLKSTQDLNPSFFSLIGFLCVARQLYEVYFYNAAMQSGVFSLWNANEYYNYAGLTFNNLTFMNCSTYVFDVLGFLPIAEGAPSLSKIPTFTFQYTKSPLLEDSIATALDTLDAEMIASQSTVKNYFSSERLHSYFLVIYSLIGMIVCFCFAALSPLFFIKELRRDTETLRQYKKLEKSLRLLSLYGSSIAVLKDEQRLFHYFCGTFLLKLVGFMKRARPFIPQTAFGDIESIIMSSTDNLHMSSNSVFGEALAHVSEDEHETPELRTEVGLQVAVGTVMCITIKGFQKNYEDDKTNSQLCSEMSNIVGLIEQIVSSHHGAIHSVLLRYIFIVWNINSSCLHHEMEALSTALDVVRLLDGRGSEVYISIASSLVSAGTIEEATQRAVMICGPAMLFCQKTQALNRYHKTSIVVDKQVASKVFSLNVAGNEYCAVPISLYRSMGKKREFKVVYGLFNSRLTEPLKAWTNTFKEFPRWMLESSLVEIREAVREYRKTFSTSIAEYPDTLPLMFTIDFWETLLEALQHSGMP